MSVTTTPIAKTAQPTPGSSVVPFPMPWGGGAPCPPPLPGCCPPGGMDALMKCYCDIQAAQAFINAMMINAFQTSPAVVAAMIAAIEASGSSLPLIGVTNGSNAQPGQVGEYIEFTAIVNFAAGNSTQTISLGVLQPGDWDCWMWFGVSEPATSFVISLNPAAPQFTNNVFCAEFNTDVSAQSSGSTIGRASLPVPTLIPYLIQINGATAAGELTLYFAARRMR